ncbi:Tetrathionate reductase subunit B precursor [Phycisphaerae bacterium RAS1]|nr:Tetrathionate reductase subunit B precursor [Phycisphaerae bacterium RAS1]
MPSMTQPPGGKLYWRSLDELAQTPRFRAFVEKEFPALASDLLSNPSRRQFLKVMGASLAMAGLTGCRWPREEILPFARQPGHRTPGVPVKFATSMEVCGVGQALLATSFDGRPIKIDGNDLHPVSGGRSDARMQASVLELYDPDRSKQPMISVGGQRAAAPMAQAWADLGKMFEAARQNKGAGLCVLSEASDSPTVAELRAKVATGLPQAKWFEYEPISRDTIRTGTKLATGTPQRPVWKLENADIIVSLDDDFLMKHPAAVQNTRSWAKNRRAIDGKMNRLYVIESTHTITGGVADHRIGMRAGQIAAAAVQIAAELAKEGLATGPLAALAERLGGAAAKVLDAGDLKHIIDDLNSHKGRSLITAGTSLPAEVHALVCWMNEALGNVPATVGYVPAGDADRPSHAEAIAALAKELTGGGVETLLIIGGNPVHNAPADLRFADALAKAKSAIHLSLFDDETSRLCTWHVPRAHYLEAWGDTRSYDGTVTLTQPLIEPLYAGKSAIELLALLTGDPKQSGYELTRRTASAVLKTPEGPDFEKKWAETLHRGFVESSAPAPAAAKVSGIGWVDGLLAAGAKSDGFEVVFRPDYKLYDGRYANNGWLQELPDPITKLTWDNVAIISVQDARAQRLRSGDVVKIDVNGGSVQLPCYVLPGHPEGTISLTLGYGRRQAGVVARGSGVDVYPLRTTATMAIAGGAKLTGAGTYYELATTQDHHSIESDAGLEETQRRIPELVREQTLNGYKANPHAAGHVVHLPTLESPFTEPLPAKAASLQAHRWGMTIDLTRCTGCSACVVACQAENNIPVVGRDEVNRGREMHWIRIDRYFKSRPQHPEHAELAVQPMTCHQCENAPCEQVCPVAATTHDADGINVMVYNRCIGTRYCSNNCPYKVRRFNWFYNHHGPKHPRSQAGGTPPYPGTMPQLKLNQIEIMVHNPDVTVRSRGVMEKCTFCQHKIAAAKIAARNAWVQADPATRGEQYTIADGTIAPACAQACPAEAIVFGDLNDPESQVSQSRADGRSYQILAEINTKPRLDYLARLRNPFGGGAGNGEHGAGHG